MRAASMLVLALFAGWALSLGAAEPAGDNKPPKDGENLKVRLHVSGAYCQGCVGVLTEALSQGGVQNATKIPANRGRGYVIVLGEIASDFNLSNLAQAINDADTPHKKQAKPGVALELFAPLNEDSAAEVKKSLEALKGVDAKHSSADPKTGVISVKLSGEDKVSVKAITTALSAAGIEAKIVTEGAAPPADAKSE